MPNSVETDLPKFIDKLCPSHGLTSHVMEGRGYYRCRKCRSQRVTEYRNNTKTKLVEAFGGACQACGYDRFVGALEFHHVDGSDKDFGLATKGRTRAYETVLAEAKKCVLVCSVCHKEIHGGVRECPPLIFSTNDDPSYIIPSSIKEQV